MNSNSFRGTQRIVSVNYLFGRPFIPSDFLKGIVTSNFRETTNFMSVVFGLLKVSFWVPKKKRSPIMFGKPTRVHKTKGFREMDKKELINSRIFNFP